MTDTLHLALPMIAAAQAQKHVTHNEALRALDALVMLSVLDRDLSAPPGSPVDGARYLVKATGSGAFAGKDGKIAHFRDGAWAFHTPRAGWIVYVADEAAVLVHDGTAWQAFPGAATPLQEIPLFGLATIADASNPISAVLNNALFAARTVANGGDGDLRYKLSKATAADTAALLFQDDFSGRAEIGLVGDDDLHLKVSADGSTWREGLVIAAATGKVSFPQGAIGLREQLTANRTYYVRTDGSDSNDGLSNSSGGAFLTVQKAIDVACALDLSIYSVTIQIGAGTYTSPIAGKSYVGAGPIYIKGDETTPSNVLFNITSGTSSVMTFDGVIGLYILSGFKFQSSVLHGIAVSNSYVQAHHIEVGACNGVQLAANFGGLLRVTSDYTISGGGSVHLNTSRGGVISAPYVAVTVTGTPNFSAAFCLANEFSFIRAPGSFTGAATGVRYSASGNAVIATGGGGASFFPGDSAGSTATGGQYL